MSPHHSGKMSQNSQVSMIGPWRSSLNVFVFVIVFIFVFVGHVMSPRQSDQIFQRSRVSRIGPWRCSLNVFSLSFLWSGHVSFIILVLNSPWPLLELLHSVIQYRAIGQSKLGYYRHHFYGQGPGEEITFKLIHSTQCTMGWLSSLMTPYQIRSQS